MSAGLVLSMALGVGTNAVVLSFAVGVGRGSLADRNLGSLMLLCARNASGAYEGISLSTVDAARTANAFESLGAVRETQVDVGFGDRVSPAAAALITPEIPRILRLGDRPGVYLAPRFWNDALNAPAIAADSHVRVDGRDVHVAGMLADDVDGLFAGRAIDVWMPLDDPHDDGLDRSSPAYWGIGRLRSGVTRATASAALRGRPETQALALLPYIGVEPDAVEGLSRVYDLLMVSAIAVFLVVGVNVVGLLLSRSGTRVREIAVRLALGASRLALARLLLADAIVVAIAGTAAGVLFAFWTDRVVPALFFDEDARQLAGSAVGVHLVVAIGACVALTMLCTLVPMFEVRSVAPTSALTRSSSKRSSTKRRFRMALVTAQTACGGALLVSAALLIHGLAAALRTAAAGSLANVVAVTVSYTDAFDARGARQFYDAVESATIRAINGSASGWASVPPGGRPVWESASVEAISMSDRTVEAGIQLIPPFPPAVVAGPPTAGRLFGGDIVPGGCDSAMVNSTAAADFFDRRAVGRTLIDAAGHELQVLGVVDVRAASGAPVATAPTVFYYAPQQIASTDDGARHAFRIPVVSKPPQPVSLNAITVSPGYFATIGARLIRGGAFPRDLRATGCAVAIVDDEAESLDFQGAAVGRAIVDSTGRRVTIIGVVHVPRLRVSVPGTGPSIYYPLAQRFPSTAMTLLAQGTETGAVIRYDLLETLNSIPGSRRPPDVRTLEERLASKSIAAERIASTLVALCGGVVLVLCVIGVFSMSDDAVRERRRELATRIAIGAQAWRLVGGVLADAMRPSATGAAIGGLVSLSVARAIAAIAPGADLDLGIWSSAALVLAAAVITGSLVPAYRAATVEPLAAMKDEE